MTLFTIRNSLMCAAAAAALVFTPATGLAADQESAAEKERKLILVLQSNAPGGEKAIACKKLAIYGSADAVKALAPLLKDEQLASWARIALEAIPGPAADNALREALSQVHGRLLVGTINSIGVRRDTKSVQPLVGLLKDVDPAVASAAAVSLGKIGGTQAAKGLKRALSKAPAEVRPAVAEGCIRCAERFFANHKASDAIKLYQAVRKAQVSKQKVLEATRGEILARQNKGIPLLLEQLKSADKAEFAMALRTARELPGPQATQAIAEELKRAPQEKQPLILLALAERGDASAMPIVLEAAKTGSRKMQVVAIGILERSGQASSLAVLLDAAVSPDNELAQPAKTAIARLPGNEVDAELLKRLPASSGKMRQVLIEMAAQRHVTQAIPVIIICAEDSDAGIRGAAVQALGLIGESKEIPELVRLLQKTKNEQNRADLEGALLAVSGRAGPGCVQQLLLLTRESDAGLRVIGLHALAAVGGPEALAAVTAAVDGKDETVQDEAVRTLSTWPNTWPEDDAVAAPLLALAKSAQKPTYQVLALRGYLQFVQRDKKLSPGDRLAKLNEVLPLLQRPEEKRLAISAATDRPSAGTLEFLLGFTSESAVAEDAFSALVSTAAKTISGISTADRQKALQAVIDHSSNSSTKKKAESALKSIE